MSKQQNPPKKAEAQKNSVVSLTTYFDPLTKRTVLPGTVLKKSAVKHLPKNYFK